MSQPHEEPDGSGTGGRFTVTLSRPFISIVRNVIALAGNMGTTDTAHWVLQAGKYIQWAKSAVISNNVERAFIGYASAAVVLRTILPKCPGYSQTMGDKLSSITSVSKYSLKSSNHSDPCPSRKAVVTFASSNRILSLEIYDITPYLKIALKETDRIRQVRGGRCGI